MSITPHTVNSLYTLSSKMGSPRAEASQADSIPSRRGQQFVEYRAPMLISSSVDGFAFDREVKAATRPGAQSKQTSH